MLERAWVLMLFAMLSGSAVADIYKYVDPSGRISYTDHPVHSGYRLLVRSFSGFTTTWRELRAGRDRLDGLVRDAARRYGLDSGLLHAVIQAESAYNPAAVSPKGAVGLMQLMPGTASRYGVRDPRDPWQNVDGGARYLRDLLGQFGALPLALAAYNAGEGAVVRSGGIPPIAETRQYVTRVMSLYRRS